MQAKGGDVPALERQPNLPSDLLALLSDFDWLNATRQQAFEGIGNLRLGDVAALHAAREWDAGGISLADYLGLMMTLDRALKRYYKERKPVKR